MSDKETLISFGFTDAKATRALKATKNAGLQQALDWLQDHADDPEPIEGEGGAEHDDEDEEGAPGGAAEAKSLKCLECGKIFRNHALASYHGEKSGHDQFEESTEEIKPLTEEEKKQKLEELKERMAEKKKVNAKREAEEAKQNEAIRRKGGKDQGQIKADLALKEAEKEALQRKKDKIEDAKAKAAVKAQIEADKKSRADKAAREKALREGKAPPPIADSPSSPAKVAGGAAVPGEKKVYKEARLQIRLPGGGALTHTVPSGSTLRELSEWVLGQPQVASSGLTSATFSSAFPRKTYGAGDLDKTVEELGLVPSAALILS